MCHVHFIAEFTNKWLNKHMGLTRIGTTGFREYFLLDMELADLHLNYVAKFERFTSYFEANYDLNDECHTADALLEIMATSKLIE
jgi:hypothetical protein